MSSSTQSIRSIIFGTLAAVAWAGATVLFFTALFDDTRPILSVFLALMGIGLTQMWYVSQPHATVAGVQPSLAQPVSRLASVASGEEAPAPREVVVRSFELGRRIGRDEERRGVPGPRRARPDSQ